MFNEQCVDWGGLSIGHSNRAEMSIVAIVARAFLVGPPSKGTSERDPNGTTTPLDQTVQNIDAQWLTSACRVHRSEAGAKSSSLLLQKAANELESLQK